MTVISKVVHAGIEYYIYGMCSALSRASADDNQAKSERAWIESAHTHATAPHMHASTCRVLEPSQREREETRRELARWANKLGGHRTVHPTVHPLLAHTPYTPIVAKAISRFAVFPRSMVWAIDIIRRILSNIWRMSFDKYTYDRRRRRHRVESEAAPYTSYKRTHTHTHSVHIMCSTMEKQASVSRLVVVVAIVIAVVVVVGSFCHTTAEEEVEVFFCQSTQSTTTTVMLSNR